jgi:uncharacterized OB-fold protein
MIENIPLPTTDDATDAPFWQAALRAELVIQRCADCQRYRFPPRPMCPECQSMRMVWQPVSGRGTIWSFAVPQPPLLPAFQALLPYVTAVVELAEHPQLRMTGPLFNADTCSIQGIAKETVVIGAPVQIAFWRCADDVAMPCWQLLDAQ